MKTPAEIDAAARRVLVRYLGRGVSTAYVCDILETDPAWADAEMIEFGTVRARVAVLIQDNLPDIANIPVPAIPATEARGQCPDCLGIFAINADGTLRTHLAATTVKGLPYADNKCSGAGGPPRKRRRPLWR
ncbi:hypothetical protein [Nocardia wallacei]|uniref:hypothetical protein n=1 Tax=Nocardia wallacei TaxID=480035 RepID=UPI0024572EDE|nr:hypothetical protein [Nocardia wallacei]